MGTEFWEAILLTCHDWGNTKAHHCFFSSNSVSEQ